VRPALPAGVWLPLAASLALLVAPWPASAGCPLPVDAGAALADVPDAARLGFLRDALVRDGENAKLWTALWGGGYLLLTGAQVAAATDVPPDQSPDWWIGAGGSALGVAAMLALPLAVQAHGPLFDAWAGALSPGHDPCALIARGERWLELDAGDEAFGTSWLVQVGNVVVNAAIALAIGFGYGHWTSAGISGGVGVLIGEAMILTQPTALVDAWERYRTAGDADAWPAR
jgi:hypothetical protein